MPVEIYPLPGPKRPIRIRYVVIHTTRGRPFEASVVFQAKRSPLSYCQQ